MNTEWKPIESAPKDELILVGPTKRMGICVAMNHGRDGWVTETCNEWCSIYTPTHWMTLPAEPCLTCNGHGMIGGLTPNSGYDAKQCPDCSPPAPTSHPIPTGATGEDERKAFETWAVGFGYQRDELARCKIGIVSPEYFDLNTENVWKAWQARAHIDAPAGGDALAVEDQQHLNWMIAEECRIETLTLGNNTRYRVHWPDVDEHQAEWFFSPGGAIRAAIAQQSQRKEA